MANYNGTSIIPSIHLSPIHVKERFGILVLSLSPSGECLNSSPSIGLSYFSAPLLLAIYYIFELGYICLEEKKEKKTISKDPSFLEVFFFYLFLCYLSIFFSLVSFKYPIQQSRGT